MGTFSVSIGIGDPQGEHWIKMNALADTGASVISVPRSILRELGVRPVMSQEFRFAQAKAGA